MSSKLVAYFSATGVTGEVAKTLAESIGADLFGIKAKTPYTQADLNWMDQNARSTIEMNDPASRPEKVEGRKMHTNAKRLFSLLLAALLAASLCACGQQSFDRTEGIEPAAAVTDESGETTLYSDSYYVDTGYRISGYCNRHFSLCGEVVSFPLGEGTILQFLNLDDVKGQPYPVGRVWEDEGLRFMMRSFCALPELGLSSLSARTIDVEYRSDIDFAREKDGLQVGETQVQEYMTALLGITAVPYEDGWLIDRGGCTYFNNLNHSECTTHYMCYLVAEPVA